MISYIFYAGTSELSGGTDAVYQPLDYQCAIVTQDSIMQMLECWHFSHFRSDDIVSKSYIINLSLNVGGQDSHINAKSMFIRVCHQMLHHILVTNSGEKG